MRVQNMQSTRGTTVPNQFIVSDGNKKAFQSYDSVICVINDNNGTITLDCDKWNCSKTTSRYRNQFLGETTKETQAKIDSGEYKLANLN